ncbi:hypothetical protein WICPIJ_001027 [Wickerhamomyces pijperi]|uniref:HIG1 domain-containing protein n=1 Tax=Wickerhamomyces pijperi TaxID=599730 RepID=A0A9P8TR47_WICPI|nr:hypothetical protein WICPIJ_001027 [Wickerhamomyces pijperi]
MKLLTDDEIEAHWWATASGACKGLASGLLVSGAIFKLGPRKWPNFPKNLPWSIRTAIFISPPTVATTIWAEEASNSFDRAMYSSDHDSKRLLEEHARWSKLSLGGKITNTLVEHKYKFIVGAWAASMYGSWVYVDKDPIMTKTQKIVQARMYAQFLTVLLLLGSIGLSIYDEKAHPENYNVEEKDDWKRILEEEQERLSREKEVAKPYQRARIYKD